MLNIVNEISTFIMFQIQKVIFRAQFKLIPGRKPDATLLNSNQNAYQNKMRAGLPHLYPKQRLPEPNNRMEQDHSGSFKFYKVKFCDTSCDPFMDFHVKQNRPVIQ